MALVPWHTILRVIGPPVARRGIPVLVKILRIILGVPHPNGPSNDLQERVNALERLNETQAAQLRWLTVIALLSVALGAVAIVALVIVVLR